MCTWHISILSDFVVVLLLLRHIRLLYFVAVVIVIVVVVVVVVATSHAHSTNRSTSSLSRIFSLIVFAFTTTIVIVIISTAHHLFHSLPLTATVLVLFTAPLSISPTCILVREQRSFLCSLSITNHSTLLRYHSLPTLSPSLLFAHLLQCALSSPALSSPAEPHAFLPDQANLPVHEQTTTTTAEWLLCFALWTELSQPIHNIEQYKSSMRKSKRTGCLVGYVVFNEAHLLACSPARSSAGA